MNIKEISLEKFEEVKKVVPMIIEDIENSACDYLDKKDRDTISTICCDLEYLKFRFSSVLSEEEIEENIIEILACMVFELRYLVEKYIS